MSVALPAAFEAPDQDAVERAIRTRRTTKQLDPDSSVDPEVIEELCELATWAPNHRKTEPWRFAVFVGDGRLRLGGAVSRALELRGAGPAAVAAARSKYLKASTVVVVGSVPGADDLVTAENRDATSAAVMALLLGATTRGLATLWSTVPTPSATQVLDLCGFPPDTFCVGAVHLAHPTGIEAAPPRSAPTITWVGNQDG